MMFLFVLQFICCKIVDLASTTIWCTAPPISPKAVNTVLELFFKAQKWEVGGRNENV